MVFELTHNVTASWRHLELFFAGEVHHGTVKMARESLALMLFDDTRVIDDDVALTRIAVGHHTFASNEKFTATGGFQMVDLG